MSHSTTKLALALDVGGTFTDVLMVDPANGTLWTAKTPSTPDDPSRAFFDGVEKIMTLAGTAPATIGRLFHGSTVATNTILESRGAATGMLVTEGFKYVLEIGRHDVPRKENLYTWVKPARPVPPRRIMEVRERTHLDGSVETELDEDACRAAARRLRVLGVESVAVVFLHAYANPGHERRAAEIVQEELPGAMVSISSDVWPVFREYERAMTTVLNAYVQPKIGSYIARLDAGLRERAIDAPLLIMKSNGGVYSPRHAVKQAVNMALSGPAAGAIGARYIGQLSGFRDAISIDIGGTSADVCLIRDAQTLMTNEGQIGPFPLAISIVEIHSVGAGGGSIASVAEHGGLAVGPRSAGAVPGPACYARGGELATVTDANLALGRIPPHLLGGEIPLNAALGRSAIGECVAGPLGLAIEEAAAGILKIVNNNMVGALKVVSIERGYDPRDFALVAFGGAGPMHAGELSRLLGTSAYVIPPHPGILCALGLLATDLQFDYVRTLVQRAPDYDLEGMEAAFAAFAEQAMADLESERVPPERRVLTRQADLRYVKQGYELTVPLDGEKLTTEAVDGLVARFHQQHEQTYTFCDRAAAVEIVNLRMSATGLVDKVSLPTIEAVAQGTAAVPVGHRRAAFDDLGWVETPVHRRLDLRAGHAIEGPAIIDQLDTTTVIFPGQHALVDPYGNLVVRLQL